MTPMQPEGLPQRFHCVDLQPVTNAPWGNFLAGERWVWAGGARNPLNALRPGKRWIAEVPFELIQDAGAGTKAYTCLVLCRAAELGLPASAVLPVGRSARWVFVLHHCNPRTDRDLAAPDTGEFLGNYTLHFDDGDTITLPIRRRIEIGDFAAAAGFEPLTAFSAVVGGEGPNALRLSVLAWEVPDPDRSIEQIEFEATSAVPIAIDAVTLAGGPLHPIRRLPRQGVRIEFPPGRNPLGEIPPEVKADRGKVIRSAFLPGVASDYLNRPVIGWGSPTGRPDGPAGLLIEAACPPEATITVSGRDAAGKDKTFDFVWQEGLKDFGSSIGGMQAERAFQAMPGLNIFQVQDVSLQVRPMYRQGFVSVTLRVIDKATGQPTPCRVALLGPMGEALPPLGHTTDFPSGWGQDVGGDLVLGQTRYAYIGGEAEYRLPVGTCYLEVVKGIEYTPIRKQLTIDAENRFLAVEIGRWVDLNARHWYSGDTHAHFLSPAQALLEARAEDLDVVNLLAAQWYTDERGARIEERGSQDGGARAAPRDPRGARVRIVGLDAISGQGTAAQADDGALVVGNTENRHPVLGHLGLLHCEQPVFPLAMGGPDASEPGDPTLQPLADWCDAAHARGGLVVWAHFPGPYLEGAADLVLGKIDAVELRHLHSTNPYCVREWYRYLNVGLRVPVVGGSDKASNSVPLGGVRTYARIEDDQPLTYGRWIEAVRRGRSFVTTGPLIFFAVNGQAPGAALELPAGGALQLQAKAISAVPFERLEVVQNGRVVASAAADETGRQATIKGSGKLTRSGWLAARCFGPETLSFDRPTQIYAHTSPVYVSVAGAPTLHPPDLAYLIQLLDGGLAWAQQQATVQTAAQRERIAEIFRTAQERLRQMVG